MAIYSRYGTRIDITNCCGKHQPTWANFPLTLCKVVFHDDDGDNDGYLHTVSMRADGGLYEIDAAVDAAPELKLDKQEFKRALKDAE